MNINFLTQPMVDTQTEEKKNTVDAVFVDRFVNGMKRIPTEIRLRFKTINNSPAITVTLTYSTRIKENLTTIANGELISAVIAAMGNQLKSIQEFQTNGNRAVEDTSENFELEMFEAFIHSQHQLKLEDDFISSYGDRFLHAIFTIGFRHDVHFYLKRDEHIEELLNEALKA